MSLEQDQRVEASKYVLPRLQRTPDPVFLQTVRTDPRAALELELVRSKDIAPELRSLLEWRLSNGGTQFPAMPEGEEVEFHKDEILFYLKSLSNLAQHLGWREFTLRDAAEREYWIGTASERALAAAVAFEFSELFFSVDAVRLMAAYSFSTALHDDAALSQSILSGIRKNGYEQLAPRAAELFTATSWPGITGFVAADALAQCDPHVLRACLFSKKMSAADARPPRALVFSSHVIPEDVQAYVYAALAEGARHGLQHGIGNAVPLQTFLLQYEEAFLSLLMQRTTERSVDHVLAFICRLPLLLAGQILRRWAEQCPLVERRLSENIAQTLRTCVGMPLDPKVAASLLTERDPEHRNIEWTDYRNIGQLAVEGDEPVFLRRALEMATLDASADAKSHMFFSSLAQSQRERVIAVLRQSIAMPPDVTINLGFWHVFRSVTNESIRDLFQRDPHLFGENENDPLRIEKMAKAPLTVGRRERDDATFALLEAPRDASLEEPVHGLNVQHQANTFWRLFVFGTALSMQVDPVLQEIGRSLCRRIKRDRAEGMVFDCEWPEDDRTWMATLRRQEDGSVNVKEEMKALHETCGLMLDAIHNADNAALLQSIGGVQLPGMMQLLEQITKGGEPVLKRAEIGLPRDMTDLCGDPWLDALDGVPVTDIRSMNDEWQLIMEVADRLFAQFGSNDKNLQQVAANIRAHVLQSEAAFIDSVLSVAWQNLAAIPFSKLELHLDQADDMEEFPKELQQRRYERLPQYAEELAELYEHEDHAVAANVEAEIVDALFSLIRPKGYERTRSAATPEELLRTGRHANCFMQTWLFAALMLRCGIPKDNLFYCQVQDAYWLKTQGGHAGLLFINAENQLQMLDVSLGMKGNLFRIEHAYGKHQAEALRTFLTDTKAQPRFFPVRTEPGHATLCRIPERMHISRIGPGIASMHLFHAGASFEERGRTEEANYCWDLSSTFCDGNPNTLYALGYAAKNAGDLQTARMQFDRLLDAYPGHVRANIAVAEMEIDAGNVAEAKRHLTRVLTCDKDIYNDEQGVLKEYAQQLLAKIQP